MPLARHRGGVAGFFEKLGNGDLRLAHMELAFGRNPVVDSGPVGAASGHEADSRGGTDRSGGVAVGEANAVLSELIKMRCLDVWMAVAFEIAVAEIVAEDDDDVGFAPGSESYGDKEKG